MPIRSSSDGWARAFMSASTRGYGRRPFTLTRPRGIRQPAGDQAPIHIRTQQPDGRTDESWSPGTREFRKVNRSWLMIHQHLSYLHEAGEPAERGRTCVLDRVTPTR